MTPGVKVLETERLILRRMAAGDAGFILGLLNEPSWLRFIGDRGVRTLEDARAYISNGPVASYERHGFGLYLVEPKGGGEPAGICGLIKRDSLEDVDLGFAFLPQFWGRGYARESAAAVLDYGRRRLGLRRVVAVTSVDNDASIRLLEKLGFRFEKPVRLSADDDEVKLFALDL